MIFHAEHEFVRWLQSQVSGQSSHVSLGIGDDAALVRVGQKHDLILTSDLSIEGVHFTTRLHPAKSVGHRALARSLSDIAAMGGVPRFGLISVAFPRNVSRAWVKAFFDGVMNLAGRFQVEIIGGDTSIVEKTTMIDVTVAGEVAHGKGLRRSGACAGDQIFVSGSLGQSALGLEILKSGTKVWKRIGNASRKNNKFASAIISHLYPEPRCELGRWLQRSDIPSALMDISDGLSTDLTRLCEASGVGAKIYVERVPRPEGVPPDHSLELALGGGEDYELLFTVPKQMMQKLPSCHQDVPLHCIGQICRSRDLLLVLEEGSEIPLVPVGYDHFMKRNGRKRLMSQLGEGRRKRS